VNAATIPNNVIDKISGCIIKQFVNHSLTFEMDELI